MKNPEVDRASCCLAAVGLIGMAGQVALLREIAVATTGSELVWIFGIGIWLLGNGLGVRSRSRPGIGSYRSLFYGLSLLFPMLMLAIRWILPAFGVPMGFNPPFSLQLALVAGTMLPAGWVIGRLFQSGIRVWLDRGGKAATAYAVECAGGVVGGILSAVCPDIGLQNAALLGIVSGCAGVAGQMAPAAAAGRTHHRSLRPWSLVLWIVWGWGVAHVDRVPWLNADFHEAIRSGAQRWMQRDGLGGRFTRIERSGQILVWCNHQILWDSEAFSSEERVHLPALLHSDPKRVLLAGGAVDGALFEVMKHGVERIDVLEMDPFLVEFVPENFPHPSSVTRSAYLYLQDSRRFLSTSNERYDLIVSTGAEPETGAANRFFTREYAQLCRQRLKDGGMLSLSLPGSENYISTVGFYRLAAVYGALRSVFGDVRVFPGTSILMVASDRPISLDMEAIQRRYDERCLHTRLVHPAYVQYLLTNDRRLDVEGRLNWILPPVNTDSHPVCYATSLWLWLSRLFPRWTHLDPADLFRVSGWMWGGFAALACGLPIWMGKSLRPKAFSLFSVGLAGFSGMLLENLWMLIYQHVFGALYRDVGLLFTAFMIGMAAGGWSVVRWGWRQPAGDIAFGVLAGCAFSAAAAHRVIHTLPSWVGFFLVGLMLFLVGAAVSVVVAVEIREAAQWDLRLSVDVTAGGMAAVIGGLVWIPVFGIPESALLVCLASVARMLLGPKTFSCGFRK